jgi:hypothetical protein
MLQRRISPYHNSNKTTWQRLRRRLLLRQRFGWWLHH